MSKNLKGKTRPQSDPYETFEGAGFTYKALKHYQAPDAEAKNPYARVFFATKSPYTFGEWELGDGYLHEVMAHAVQTQGEPIGFKPLRVPEML